MIPDAGRWGKRGPRHLQRRSGSASSRRAGARAHEGDRQGLGGSGVSPQCGSVFGLSKSVSPSVNGDKCPPPRLLGALQEISRWGWPRAWHLVCPPVLLSPRPGGPEKFGDKKEPAAHGQGQTGWSAAGRSRPPWCPREKGAQSWHHGLSCFPLRGVGAKYSLQMQKRRIRDEGLAGSGGADQAGAPSPTRSCAARHRQLLIGAS